MSRRTCCLVLILLLLLVAEGRVSKPRKLARRVEKYHGNKGMFSSVQSKLSNVYVSSSNVFPYYDITLARQAEGFVPEYALSDVYDKQASTFQYFSGDIMDDKFTSLRNELDLSATVRSIIQSKDILSRLTANLWVGDAGVVAAAHYDSVYNVYIQVEGTKRFTLLPPTAVHALQVYGRMHPYACQSRVANLTTALQFHRRPYCITGPCGDNSKDTTSDYIAHTGETAEPTGADASCGAEYLASVRADMVQHTLHPGDVLVIPPYWFHEVETVTDAVAVSLWWDAAQLDVMDEMYALPLPFEASWAEDLLLRAVGEFATALLNATVLAVEAAVVAQTTRHVREQCMKVTTPAGGGFTVDSIHRLLRVRYLEDVTHRERHRPQQDQAAPAGDTSTATGGPISSLSLDEATARHIRRASEIRASLFAARFLSWDMFARSEELHLFDATIERTGPTEDACEAGQGAAALADLRAVLMIKLCDYVEDVFRHASEMLLAGAGSGRFSRLQGGERRGLNAVAVELLLEWLQPRVDMLS